MIKLLLIEDEKNTAEYLKKGFSEQGIMTTIAHNGIDGLLKAKKTPQDLILLDIMLPKLNGWEILTQYRKTDKHTPILLLTAKDSVHDRVKGLNMGADDYLVKPFSFAELLARIHSLVRRTRDKNLDSITEELTISDLTINYHNTQVTRSGKPIHLTAKEFALISYLAKNYKRIVSRTMIAATVWDIHFETGTNIIDVAIRRLRQKIDKPYSFPLIHTERGLGYILEDRHHV